MGYTSTGSPSLHEEQFKVLRQCFYLIKRDNTLQQALYFVSVRVYGCWFTLPRWYGVRTFHVQWEVNLISALVPVTHFSLSPSLLNAVIVDLGLDVSFVANIHSPLSVKKKIKTLLYVKRQSAGGCAHI